MDDTILEAIPGDNPSGVNLRYDAVYSEIRARVRRARGEVLPEPGDPSFAGVAADWQFVVHACRHVLIRRSKDLMIAAWLTEALLAVEGFKGLHEGLDIVRGLVEGFWETLYPEIEDGDVEARVRIVEWMDTHLSGAIYLAAKQDTKKTESSAIEVIYQQRLLALIDCRDSLIALDDACSAKLHRRGPNLEWAIFGAMRETLQNLASVVVERGSPEAASALRGGFRDWITRDGLEELLRYRARRPVASADDEFLSTNDPIASAPPPPSFPTSPPPPAPSMAPPSPAQGSPVRIRKLSDGKAQREPVAPMPPSASAPAKPSPVVSREGQRVVFTLTAPEHVTVKVPFELFVWAHGPEERAKVLARAREELGRDILERAKGPVRIASGTTLSVRLTIPGAEIDEPEDTMVWEGESTCASFVVRLPELGEGGKSPGVAHIYANGVQVARISFVLSAAGVVESAGVRYKKAFASYASDDRDAVLGRIQGIHKVVPEMEIFLDVVSLRSGQNWEQELWRVIPESDIFYLFWSHHARESEWVEKEWRCALKERGIEFIDPVPLESPRESPPPPELSALHFNDWELAFRRR